VRPRHPSFYRPLCLLFILSCGLVVFPAPRPATAQQEPPSPIGPLSPRTGLLLKDHVIARLIQVSSGDRAKDYVSQIALWDREQATEGYARAAEWVAAKAREFGLEQVGIERFPCDGKIEYFGQIMAPRWKVRKGELRLTSPLPMQLASYDDLPMSLAEGSTSADIEAEIVDIGAGTADRDYAGGVKGKIVLTTGRPAAIYERAVLKEGAAGMVSSWSVPDFDHLNRRAGDFPDQVGWSRIPREAVGGAGRFAFLISSRLAQELRLMILQGKVVRVHAEVDAGYVPGNLEIVSGLIPGSTYPQEEVLVTAHLDHYKPGANDNASGSATVLEMARTMRALIEAKELPRPLRTVRFMWVPEYDGTYAWLAAHLNDRVKRIADINFDMVGENVMASNSVINLCRTSDSNPSFLNSLMESILDFMNRFNDDRYPVHEDLYIGSTTGSRNRAAWRMAPFNWGSDHALFNKLGIGAASLIAWPDNFYHSSEDSPDKVDPTQLHRAVVLGLAAAGVLGYADSEQATGLARLALVYGRRRIAGVEFSAVRSLLSAAKDGFNEADRMAGNRMAHAFSRERAAVGSAAIFARTANARNDVRQTVSWLDADEAAVRKRLDDLAGQRAKEISLARAPKPQTDEEERAARLIPAWNEGKELFAFGYVQRVLANDPAAMIPKIEAALDETGRLLRDQGLDELQLYGFSDTASLYVDGKRSVLGIRDAVAAEYAPVPLEILTLYFRAFEKAGVMRVRRK